MAKVGQIEEIPCIRCGRTEHTLLASYDTDWNSDEHDISGGSTHDFLSCNGCKRGTYRTTSWFSEEPGESSIDYYPPRPSDKPPREPLTFENLPHAGAVKSVYVQTIGAYNAGSRTLAAAGVRLLIEGTCRDQNILKGKNYTDQNKLVRDRNTGKILPRENLEGKINGMRDKGLISKNQAKVLHQLRKLGNDAAHELDEPSLDLIGECLDAVEHMFEQVYDQPKLLVRLTNRKAVAKKK